MSSKEALAASSFIQGLYFNSCTRDQARTELALLTVPQLKSFVSIVFTFVDYKYSFTVCSKEKVSPPLKPPLMLVTMLGKMQSPPGHPEGFAISLLESDDTGEEQDDSLA